MFSSLAAPRCRPRAHFMPSHNGASDQFQTPYKCAFFMSIISQYGALPSASNSNVRQVRTALDTVI